MAGRRRKPVSDAIEPETAPTKKAGPKARLQQLLMSRLATEAAHIGRCVVIRRQIIQPLIDYIGRAFGLHGQTQITAGQQVIGKLATRGEAELSIGPEIGSLPNFLNAPSPHLPRGFS